MTTLTRLFSPINLVSGNRNRNFYHSRGRQLQSLRKKSPEAIAQLNPATANSLHRASHDWIWIETALGHAHRDEPVATYRTKIMVSKRDESM